MAETTSPSRTVYDVVEHIREVSTSNHQRGVLFENLMSAYLTTDPTYANRFEKVWRWADWPDAPARNDDGIDLVARTFAGGYCAIQCKFYEPHHVLQKSDIDSFFTASGKAPFTERLIISTTDRWGANAEKALGRQQIPVARLGLGEIADSPVSWERVWPAIDVDFGLERTPPHELRPHQVKAVDAVFEGFTSHERGQLIMACGTGKTFTSLKIAERLAAERAEEGRGVTRVLFLVPSISLLSQTLREWSAQCLTPLNSFAVCSDAKVSKKTVQSDFQDMSTHDLALPATTDAATLVDQVRRTATGEGLQVVFSTYQSIAAVHEAQRAGLGEFDLVVCDEAHRTTGVTLAGESESHFVRVHDNDYLRAEKRLYMTATPRVFDERVRSAAKERDAVLCSMADESLFGPEFHRLGFGEAVEQDLLTDYRVLILNVDETALSSALQSEMAEDGELKIGDAAKIVGCWNGLSKRAGHLSEGQGFEPGEPPMRRAVAFARSIAESKQLTEKFPQIIDAVNAERDGRGEARLRCEVEHVDGGFNALERNRSLEWLKADPGEDTCRDLVQRPVPVGRCGRSGPGRGAVFASP